jgi:hypothetical protein
VDSKWTPYGESFDIAKDCWDLISERSVSRLVVSRVFEGIGDKFIVVKAKIIANIPIETNSSTSVNPNVGIRPLFI